MTLNVRPGLPGNRLLHTWLLHAELFGQSVRSLAVRVPSTALQHDLRRQFRGVMSSALLTVSLRVYRHCTRQPGPVNAGDCLAHCASLDTELGGERLLRFPCRIPAAALQHIRFRELGLPLPLAPVARAVTYLVRPLVLLASPPGQVAQTVVERATWTMQGLLPVWARTDECLKYKLMDELGSTRSAVTLTEDHAQVRVHARRCRTQQAAALPGASSRMETPDSPKVADGVQPLIADYRLPGLRGSVIRSHCGLLYRSWWSGPGSGVGSTVRAVLTFQSIIADSLAISAATERGDG